MKGIYIPFVDDPASEGSGVSEPGIAFHNWMAWVIASRTGFTYHTKHKCKCCICKRCLRINFTMYVPTLSNLQRSRERRQEVLKEETKYPELTAILERAREAAFLVVQSLLFRESIILVSADDKACSVEAPSAYKNWDHSKIRTTTEG